ncbi:MAG: D-tyrosyl-tRNA(Tyr) deacylase [Chloroflexi bacterium]|nr:D-tyrosyl-tRNA(Tyr) deacylase [Chloroflexota bacterium]
MRALIQRATRGAVRVENQVVGEIARGLVVFVGVTHTDDVAAAQFLAQKVANLRIFEDDASKFNLSALDVNAELLVISQFTLYADARRGRRPDFIAAARPEIAAPLVETFARNLEATGLRVARGQFQAKMRVEIWNDGPVTIMLDTDDLRKRNTP